MNQSWIKYKKNKNIPLKNKLYFSHILQKNIYAYKVNGLVKVRTLSLFLCTVINSLALSYLCEPYRYIDRVFSELCYPVTWNGEWENWRPMRSFYLKGQCQEILCFWFFSWISFPTPPPPRVSNKDSFKFFRKFVEIFPSQGALPVSTTRYRRQICHQHQRHRRQICHRCQRHWWQIMGTISGCRYLKVNLKAKIYIYVNSTIQRCPNKIIKNFSDRRFFSFANGVNDNGSEPWSANISANFRKNLKRP